MNRLRHLSSAVIAAALVALPAAPALAQVTTVGTPVPTSTFNGLYSPFVPYVGQSFVTPVGASYLQRFTVFLGDSYNGANLRFDAAVYALGSDTPLFTAATGRAGSSNALGLDPYTFDFANLLLAPSTTYAFLLTATSVADGDENGAANVVGTTDLPDGTPVDSYAGGSILFGFDGGPGGVSAGDGDLAFQATFTAAPTSAVPEPATFALVAGGLALVGVAARRRRA